MALPDAMSILYFSLAVGAGLAFYLIVVKYESQRYKDRVVADDAKDHTRTGGFLLRAIYWHAWVKGRRILHSFAGVLFLGSGVLEMVAFPLSWVPNYWLRTVFTSTGVMMALGLLTPHMSRGRHKLGKKQLVFIKHMAMIQACVCLANSIYAPPVGGDATAARAAWPAPGGTHPMTARFFTLAALALPMATVAALVSELVFRAVWSTKDVSIGTVTGMPIWYTAPLVHFVHGDAYMREWYASTRVAGAVYMLAIATACFITVDQLFLEMVHRGIMYQEQRKNLLAPMWALFGILLAPVVLCTCVSPRMGFFYIFFCGLNVPVKKLIPERFFEGFEENRRGLHDAVKS